MRLCLVITALVGSVLALPMNDLNNRVDPINRERPPMRGGYDGETRHHLQSGRVQAEGGRDGLKDRTAEMDRTADIERTAEEDRTADIERTAEEVRSADIERTAEKVRSAEKERTAQKERTNQEERTAQVERTDQVERTAQVERAADIEREPDVPGSPPHRALPEVRGVNWVSAKQGDFPFMVRLSAYYTKPDGNWYFEPCGAAILSETRILTAAHCFDNQRANGGLKPALVYAYFNDFDTNAKDESAISTASSIHLHPAYSKTTHPKNDIAVVALTTRLDFSALGVNSICLDTSPMGGGVPITIAGWGKTHASAAKMNDKLFKSTNEHTLSNAQCKATSYSDAEIDDGVICATGLSPSGVQDACQGDSGGPMFRNKGGHWAQVGVVSWGRGCARAEYPGIFTRVSKFVGFVQSHCPEVHVC